MSLQALVKRVCPPLTHDSFCRHYYPLSGAISHGLFAVTVTNPNLLSRCFPRFDWAIGNAIFFNATLGAGVYTYHRAHMLRVAPCTRVMYCVFAAGIFSFGSVMLWATSSVVFLPRNTLVRSLFALLTSGCLLAIGRDYLRYVDTLLADEDAAM